MIHTEVELEEYLRENLKFMVLNPVANGVKWENHLLL